MKDPNRNVIYFLWLVVVVVIIGAAVAVFMLVHRADQLSTENDVLKGNTGSLQEQLRQAKQSPTPVVTPLPEATGNGPAPAATATPAPKPTPTPKPQP